MAIKLVFFFAVIFMVFHEGHLQLSKMSTCSKDIKPKAKFSDQDFKGVWYEIKRYPTVMILGTCVSINYNVSENSTKIITSQVMPNMNATTSASGLADFAKHRGKSASVPGTWNFRMTLGLLSSNASFTIVDTDYKNWAAMYSCGDFFGYSSLQSAWIYSRTRELSEKHLESAMKAFESYNIDRSFVTTDQTGCPVDVMKPTNKPTKKA